MNDAIDSADGVKSVNAIYRDGAGWTSGTVTATVVLDVTAPDVSLASVTVTGTWPPPTPGRR